MERTILVIYSRNRPHSIITDKGHTYDIHYSRLDDCYYSDLSGAGGIYGKPYPIWPPDADYWLEESSSLQVSGGRRRFKTSLFSKPVEDWSRESDCAWCRECNSWLPTMYYDQPCKHIAWCEECGWWSTPDEPCWHLHYAE